MKIPYANCNFPQIRREGYFYVDKTPFIPQLENVGGRYLLFLRPRRFGKTTLISTLANYYDIDQAGNFDELFGGLWIHQRPTDNKNKYLVLRLDFSPVSTDGAPEDIRRSFAVHVRGPIKLFISRYRALIPGLSLLELPEPGIGAIEDPAELISRLLICVQEAGQQVYLFIDEYDHFGNRLLSDGLDEVYQDLVRSAGFVRSFYAALKAFSTTGTLARMFVTGVSPIMLDDLSSGFNIIKHISQRDAFHAMAGFTRADVEGAVDMMLRDMPDLAHDPRIRDRALLLDTLEQYYNGYRFSRRAAEKMYNSTLVLYFIDEVLASGYYPYQMLDLNVRTDYGRLYLLARAASGRATGTRELLEEILCNESIESPLVEQFGTKAPFGAAQIVSLFYYMGMLTFADDAAAIAQPKLVIPNRVMRELQWGYMAIALSDHEGLRIDMSLVERALGAMARHGDIQPLIALFHEQVVKRLGLRELIHFDEKTMKLMLFTYLSQSQAFYLMSEKEFNQGYCDLLLGLRGNAVASKYAWIIEAKYVKTDASDKTIEASIGEGFAQLERYASDKDLVSMLTLGNQLKAGVLVFVGFKDLRFYPWPKLA